MKILFVDDDQDILKCYDTLFANAFPDIGRIFASNGQIALEICLRIEFRLIITDYRMPKLKGNQLIQEIRSSPGPNQHTSVVLVSKDFSDLSFYDSADSSILFLPKPVDENMLLSIFSVLSEVHS